MNAEATLQPALRKIIHVDMDAFFASVEQRDDPALRGRPVAVGGASARGVVAAASYEARKYGVHSAMPSSRALRLCPEVVFIPPDFRRYSRESEKIFAIYREITPLVQAVSIDEAYLDVTDYLGEWGTATRAAKEIRRRVREERGLTVSVGVGPNRLIAKIASDFHKPDGLTVVPPHKVQAFLDPLPVRRLHGVGPATEKALADLVRGLCRRSRLDDAVVRITLTRGRYLGDLGNTPGHVNHWSARAFERFVGTRLRVTDIVKPLPWTMVRATPIE